MKSALLWILPLCLISLACSEIKRPTASVQSVALREITSTGFTMNFNVQIDNPNAVALPVSDMDYRLQLAGAKVLQGAAQSPGSIPAKGQQAIDLPVVVNFEDLLAVADGIRKSGGDVPYAFDANFQFNSDLAWLTGPVRLPVTYQGTLRVRDLLKDPLLLLKSPTAQKLAERLLGWGT
ncbi:MAG TPA: LEA type 2 family protein [Tepidisphaeraceae bacterium]|nr:LEA type 2 family protein [Tepidisphaeraceae bacterium]